MAMRNVVMVACSDEDAGGDAGGDDGKAGKAGKGGDVGGGDGGDPEPVPVPDPEPVPEPVPEPEPVCGGSGEDVCDDGSCDAGLVGSGGTCVPCLLYTSPSPRD